MSIETPTMNAIVSREPLPIDNQESLVDARIPVPALRPRDVLVRVEAVSVNPIDVKTRIGANPSGDDRVLGFDASGTVVAVGADAALFAVGDEVFYAGSIDRAGSNAEFQAVDERIVGRKPATLSHAEAAALPLTSITAWESLFDRFRLGADSTGTLLVLGAAGGVGSILIQLAKKLTSLTVIASASRPETSDWVGRLGADHVVDHRGDLAAEILAVAPEGVDYIFTPQTPGNLAVFQAVAKPFAEITAIDNTGDGDLGLLKLKSITWHWELMFTRPLFQTPDMIEQHRLLNRVSELVDQGVLRSTLTRTLSPVNAEQLREAHRLVESGSAIGKVVVAA